MEKVYITGDEVWRSFDGIFYIIDDDERYNDVEYENIDIIYSGTFGDEEDDPWLDSVPEVVESVNSITFTDWDTFKQYEKDVVYHTIDKYNLPKEKFIFG